MIFLKIRIWVEKPLEVFQFFHSLSVYRTCKHLNKDQLKEELIESKRIDAAYLHELNKNLLQDIAKSYHSKHVYYLADLIGAL